MQLELTQREVVLLGWLIIRLEAPNKPESRPREFP